MYTTDVLPNLLGAKQQSRGHDSSSEEIVLALMKLIFLWAETESKIKK